MELDDIINLLRRYLSEGLTESERERLENWSAQHPANKDLLESLSDEESLFAGYTNYLAVYDEAVSNRLRRIGDTLMDSIVDSSTEGDYWRQRLFRWLPYVAAMLIAMATAVWYFIDNQLSEESEIVGLQGADIAPGGNRATLTLADGRTITLDEARDGIVIGGGEITYDDGNPLTEVGSKGETVLLELSTPKGGTYQATLSDGTKVWLNAESTLKYPSRFANSERRVFLNGEAYFEVPQVETPTGRMPFEVVSNGQTVAVLGTEFNISAYTADVEIKTTLVAGSVEVVNHQSKAANRIKPGQQAIVAGTDTDIGDVDIHQYTAWKNGLFYFDGLSPQVAFDELARWYDLDIIFEPKGPAFKFFGVIERDKPLGSILNILGKSGLKFEVRHHEGRNQLIVLNE